MITPIAHPVHFQHRSRRGPFHFICLPGLVPDGPETFLRQRTLLQRYGSVSVATWPAAGFDLDHCLAGIGRRVEEAINAGQRPVVLAVSFGGGLYLELLRRARLAGQPLPVAASVLISPMPGPRDLSPLLTRIMRPIVDQAQSGEDASAALERGRSFFRMLAARSAGVESTDLRWTTFLTPGGLRRYKEGQLRQRIETTLATMPTEGAIERIIGLAALNGVDERTSALSEAPTLILWGSRERHTLSMEGPGTGVLSRPDLASKVFPRVEVQYVYDRDGAEVPHASLIKHARAFNPHLRRFLHRLHQRSAATRLLRLPFLDRLSAPPAEPTESQASAG